MNNNCIFIFFEPYSWKHKARRFIVLFLLCVCLWRFTSKSISIHAVCLFFVHHINFGQFENQIFFFLETANHYSQFMTLYSISMLSAVYSLRQLALLLASNQQWRTVYSDCKKLREKKITCISHCLVKKITITNIPTHLNKHWK